MMRTKGEAGSGNIVEAVRHMRKPSCRDSTPDHPGPEELMAEAKELGAPYELVRMVAPRASCRFRTSPPAESPRRRTPRLMMQLGAEAVFVGSGIFKSSDPAERAHAIVRATTHYGDPAIVAEVSKGLGEAMHGIETSKLEPESELLQTRGW